MQRSASISFFKKNFIFIIFFIKLLKKKRANMRVFISTHQIINYKEVQPLWFLLVQSYNASIQHQEYAYARNHG
jgi:hypothetical protein